MINIQDHLRGLITRYLKTLIAVSLLLFLFTFLHPSINEYNVNVIESMSIFYKIGLITCLTLSSLLLIYANKLSHVIGSIFAFSFLYLSYFTLPYTRGYYLYGRLNSDHHVHLGLANDILSNGFISDLTYPGLHIIVGFLAALTDLPPKIIIPLISLTFMTLFVLSTYIVGRFFISNFYASITAACSMPLIFGAVSINANPWYIALLLLPTCIYFCIRYIIAKRFVYSFGLILVCLSLTLYHPVSATYALFSTILLYTIYSKQLMGSAIERSEYSIPIIISFVLVPYYHLYNQTVDGSLRAAITRIFIRSQGAADEYATGASQTDYTLLQIIEYFIIPNWGIIFIYFSASSILIITYILKSHINSNFILYSIINFIVGVFVAIPFMFIGIRTFSPIRASQLGILFSIFLFGCLIFIIYKHKENGLLNATILAIVIALLAVSLGMGILYTHPDNAHITKANYDGHEWYYDNRNPTFNHMSEETNNKLVYNIYGYTEGLNQAGNGPIESNVQLSSIIQDQDQIHFENNSYIYISTKDMKWYQSEPDWRHQDLNFLTQYHRNIIEKDTSKIYSNSDATVYIYKN